MDRGTYLQYSLEHLMRLCMRRLGSLPEVTTHAGQLMIITSKDDTMMRVHSTNFTDLWISLLLELDKLAITKSMGREAIHA